MKKLLLFFVVLCVLPAISYGQGVTTSSMRGQIVDATNMPLIGVNVAVVNSETGVFYGASTDVEGFYRIDNMRVGGPYKVTISYVGQTDQVIENVHLRLGEPYRRNIVMSEESTMLDDLVITGRSGSVGKSTGTSTQISEEAITTLPTLNRNMADFTRLTPQASTAGAGTSFGGMNNRFNAIYVDGAVNNDVFGLSNSGTNGGQTGVSPFSMDIIDQIQVVLSPYDVSLGGFAGGGVNAVTKSGTNKIKGTAYYYFQNQSLVGKTNNQLTSRTHSARTRVDTFSQKTTGISIGGPIIKNKLHFFVNAEIQRDETPIPFDLKTYGGDTDEEGLNELRDFLINTHSYDPGTFGSSSDNLDGLKVFGKLDYSINADHKLTFRHSYTKGERFNRNGSSSRNLNFSNNGIFFPSTTNSSALELNSTLGQKMSNNLIIGYTSVYDDRDPLGDPFPYVIIDDGAGTIRLGGEPFSSANLLDQKILTVTDNFKIYRGKHTFTIGTHNEFYKIRNVFLPWNLGQYEFNSVDDFTSGAPADSYRRVYSLVDDVAGDDTKAAAEFGAMQLGFYLQDAVEVNDKLTITGGIRLDVPFLSDDPEEAPRFNDSIVSKLVDSYPAFEGQIEAGKAPDGQLMWSPRIGFEYTVDEERTTIVRGGVGVFTSRIPFVWPGAMYNNNGLTSTFLGHWDIEGDVEFIADPQKQYTHEEFETPSGDMNLFVKNFKYPQVLRTNLAVDKKLANGWNASAEGMLTKTLNNVAYTNVNTSTEVDFYMTGSGDNRPVFVNSEIDEDAFGAVYVGSNTSEGYGYNITGTLSKNFSTGFNTSIAYTYGDSYGVNEGTSSQNSSQWRGQINIDGRNNPVYGRSDFSAGHRILGTLGYKVDWSKASSTTFTVLYNGQSGQAMSYVVGGDRDARNFNNQKGSTSRYRSLVYVPAGPNDINLVPYMDGDQEISAELQWDRLNNFIESEPSLKSRRGNYVEKNGARTPWANMLDFAIRQDLGADLGGNLHKIQLSLDVFNFANLVNSHWGTRYNVRGDFNNYFLLDFEEFAEDGTTPTYTFRENHTGLDSYDINDLGSRWRMRLGIRYIFD